MKTVNILQLIGPQVAMRASVRNISNHVGSNDVINFNGVTFITRSAMDEFCNLLDEKPAVKVTGMSDFVSNMFDIVIAGRKKYVAIGTTMEKSFPAKR